MYLTDTFKCTNTHTLVVVVPVWETLSGVEHLLEDELVDVEAIVLVGIPTHKRLELASHRPLVGIPHTRRVDEVEGLLKGLRTHLPHQLLLEAAGARVHVHDGASRLRRRRPRRR